MVLEYRECLSKHAPESESLCPVLEPCALADRECTEGWSDEKCKTGIEGVMSLFYTSN